MKRFFLIVAVALLMMSCGNSYIEDYEAICRDAKEQVEAASSVREIMSVMKQMRSDIKELNEEYPEEAEKYKTGNPDNEEEYKIWQHRVRVLNEVNAKASLKRRRLLDNK